MLTKDKDIREKIKCGFYLPAVEHPRKPAKPHIAKDHNWEDAQDHANLMKKYENAEAIYKTKIKEYRAHRGRLLDTLKQDMLEEVGLTAHKKAERAYSMAMDQSRSDGYVAVLDTLEEYADLLI